MRKCPTCMGDLHDTTNIVSNSSSVSSGVSSGVSTGVCNTKCINCIVYKIDVRTQSDIEVDFFVQLKDIVGLKDDHYKKLTTLVCRPELVTLIDTEYTYVLGDIQKDIGFNMFRVTCLLEDFKIINDVRLNKLLTPHRDYLFECVKFDSEMERLLMEQPIHASLIVKCYQYDIYNYFGVKSVSCEYIHQHVVHPKIQSCLYRKSYHGFTVHEYVEFISNDIDCGDVKFLTEIQMYFQLSSLFECYMLFRNAGKSVPSIKQLISENCADYEILRSLLPRDIETCYKIKNVGLEHEDLRDIIIDKLSNGCIEKAFNLLTVANIDYDVTILNKFILVSKTNKTTARVYDTFIRQYPVLERTVTLDVLKVMRSFNLDLIELIPSTILVAHNDTDILDAIVSLIKSTNGGSNVADPVLIAACIHDKLLKTFVCVLETCLFLNKYSTVNVLKRLLFKNGVQINNILKVLTKDTTYISFVIEYIVDSYKLTTDELHSLMKFVRRQGTNHSLVNTIITAQLKYIEDPDIIRSSIKGIVDDVLELVYNFSDYINTETFDLLMGVKHRERIINAICLHILNVKHVNLYILKTFLVPPIIHRDYIIFRDLLFRCANVANDKNKIDILKRIYLESMQFIKNDNMQDEYYMETIVDIFNEVTVLTASDSL